MMSRMTKAERWNLSYRRLHFGDIQLVPVADRDWFPYDAEWNEDKWHVPGRKIMSTEALVKLATKQGVTVTLVEHAGSTQLN